MMKAFKEAEAYDGPSLILAYSPCINQGIMVGMGKTQEEMNLAVKSGYWPIYRYNPDLADEGKNPFTLDCKAPDGSLKDFLNGEIRFASLTRTFPEEAERLHAMLEETVNERFQELARMADPTIVCKESDDSDKASEAIDES